MITWQINAIYSSYTPLRIADKLYSSDRSLHTWRFMLETSNQSWIFGPRHMKSPCARYINSILYFTCMLFIPLGRVYPRSSSRVLYFIEWNMRPNVCSNVPDQSYQSKRVCVWYRLQLSLRRLSWYLLMTYVVMFWKSKW